MRIKFIVIQSNSCSASLTNPDSSTKVGSKTLGELWTNDHGQSNYYLTPTYYFLKSFYKKIGKYYSKYTWLPTEYGLINSNMENIISSIEKEKPDIICFSMFLWNFDVQIKIANIIKQKHPNIKLIAGGPNIDHKTLNTANKYPFIDYLVYGDGEKAFTMLLDSFYEPIDEKTIPNLITKKFKTNHEVLRFKDYPAFNLYYDLKEDFTDEYNRITNYINKNNTNIELIFSWERLRGCPYACTFCDWSAGLHHKLNKRLGDWKKEIKFLASFNNITMQWIDANIGMLKDDIEIYKFAISLSYINNSFSFSGGNMAKINKDRVFEIWEEEYLHGHNSHGSRIHFKNHFKISLQHQDEQVLKNINRPEISWKEHKELLTNFKQKYNKVKYKVELILGLPGGTVENHRKQLIEFSEISMNTIDIYAWELLHNSPAHDKSYQEKHNLKIFTAGVILPNMINSPIDDLYDNISSNNHNPMEIYQLERIYDGNLSFKEYLSIIYMSILYNIIFENVTTLSSYYKIKFVKSLDYAMPIIEKLADIQSKDWEEKLEKYGFIIFGLPYNKTQTIQLNTGLSLICHKLFNGILSEDMQTPELGKANGWWNLPGNIETKERQRELLSEF